MATSTAARRKATATTQPQQEVAPEWRGEMIAAIGRLNHRQGGTHWWSPTDLRHELEQMRGERRKEQLGRPLKEKEMEAAKVSRSTVGMRLERMRSEKIIAFESLINAGAIVGTAGFRYALIGTPPSGDARVVEDADEMETRALALAHEAAVRAAQRKPPRRAKSRVATGRVPVTTTADAKLWQRAQQAVLRDGVPKAKVLDTILQRYLDAPDATPSGGGRNPYERTSRYLPRSSRPVSATA